MFRDESADSAASRGWNMGTTSRVVVVEVLCKKVSKRSEDQCNVLDFSFCGRREYVGGATLFCGERQAAMREETVRHLLLHRPCPVLLLPSLVLSSRRSTLC